MTPKFSPYTCIAWVIVMSVASERLRAQAIILESAGGGLVVATASSHSTVANDVDSLPDTTVTSNILSDSSSVVTPNFTSNSLRLSALESITSSEGYTAGDGAVNFTAGSNVTFTLAGSSTFTGAVDGAFSTYLYDFTTAQYIYYFGLTPDSTGTFQLSASGGPLSGSLTAGDRYNFTVNNVLGNGPSTLNGNVTLTLTQSAPEPSTWTLLFSGLGLLALWGTRRRRSSLTIVPQELPGSSW